MTKQLYINSTGTGGTIPHKYQGFACKVLGCIPYVPKTLIVPASPTPNNQDQLMCHPHPKYSNLPPHIWCRECMEAGCVPYNQPANPHPQELDKTIGHKSIEDTFPDSEPERLWILVDVVFPQGIFKNGPPDSIEYDYSNPWEKP